MDKLYQTLYLLYSNELMNLNIGYSYNEHNLSKMMEIVGAINYMQQSSDSKDFLCYINMYYD